MAKCQHAILLRLARLWGWASVCHPDSSDSLARERDVIGGQHAIL